MSIYVEGIKKTGFILEHQIVTLLQNEGWSIISNKYYEDDLQKTVREIDIVAYKVRLVDDVYIYTTLIISCKKSDKNAWVMVSRDLNEGDPNSNWWPLHKWTDDRALQTQFNSTFVTKKYYESLENHIGSDYFGLPTSDVFAFQEMDKRSGNPQNDKAIFNSITGLMKALSYEMSVRKTKEEYNSIYQFNLISIVDSDLIELHMKDDEINGQQVECLQLISQYIINREKKFFKVRFIDADFAEKQLKNYDLLHEYNCSYFGDKKSEFIKDSITDFKKVDVLKYDFYDRIRNSLERASNFTFDLDEVKKNLVIIYESSKKSVRIFVTEDNSICAKLNKNESVKKKVKDELLRTFRYTGDFHFSTDNLPF